MIIRNSADVINFSCEAIEKLVGKNDMDYDKLHQMVVACLLLERYVTLMEERKRDGNLYGDAGCFMSTTCYESCFNMFKRYAETELKIIDGILSIEPEVAE